MQILYWGNRPERFSAALEADGQDSDALLALPLETPVESLRRELARHRADLRLVVFDCPAVGDLLEMLPVEPLLRGVPVIEMLEEDDPALMALAHRFRPRFVCCERDGWGDAVLVAANIIHGKKVMH
jgi:hypothetical protein